MARKYRQPGYQDYDKEDRERKSAQPRPQRQDHDGPRTPRMTGSKVVARCFNCGTVLPALSKELGECGKCNSSLRCCKMCNHFDPGSRYECTEEIEVRVSPKDRLTSCEFFAVRTTVEKDTSGLGAAGPAAAPNGNSASGAPSSGSSDDARKAFENLFKK